MFLASLFLLFAAPGSPLSASDAAFLTRIDRAVSRMSDRKTAFVRFEKAVTKADAIRCNRLLPNLKPNSVSYADCAFVQAWHGIDYDENIHRLQRPYQLWRADTSRWAKEYPNDTDGQKLTDMDSMYTTLNWLYLKHHDLKSLGAWEDLRLDGAWAEGSDEELSDLWANHAPDMLEAAYRAPRRIEKFNDSAAICLLRGRRKNRQNAPVGRPQILHAQQK